MINPVYTVFIAHLKPEMCPLGAFAFYFHYLYDEKELTKSMDIDWTSNSSWRQVFIHLYLLSIEDHSFSIPDSRTPRPEVPNYPI